MRFVGAKAAKSRSKQKPAGEIVIPDRLYFRIGEVSRLCSLPAYVLRFWETEFPQLKPNKSNTGQRLYRRKDIENIIRVKRLLYEEGYTIPGARQMLKAESRRDRSQPILPFRREPTQDMGMRQLRQGLREILSLLSSKK